MKNFGVDPYILLYATMLVLGLPIVFEWNSQFQITVLGCNVLCIESCNIDFLGGNAGGIFVNSLILMKNMKCQKLYVQQLNLKEIFI